MKEHFYFSKRLKSFVYAGKGIVSFIKKEHNAWIHLSVSILVVFLGLFFHISSIEWIAVIICISLVLSAEAFNTAIERLVDFISPEHNKAAGEIKDIAAGAVLICAIATAIVGLIIFIPKLIEFYYTS